MMQSINFSRFARLNQFALRFQSSQIRNFQNVGVVGLGLMGHGIAQTAAAAGCNVICTEHQQQALDNGQKAIENSLNKIISKKIKKGIISADEGKMEFKNTTDRIQYNLDQNSLHDCDLIIEAIIEDISIKNRFYENLGKIVNENCIFGSNTSSLPITSFAEASGRPQNFVGIHFFNPVQIMRLVEVIETRYTDPQVFSDVKEWVTKIGKTPVSCKDTPGFIVNRLLVPFMAQGMLMLDRGDATVQDIDISMQFGASHPMGPFTLADYVGLDTSLSILQGWATQYPNEPTFIVPECLKQKVKEGKLGRKSGVGFYNWEGDKRLDLAN